MAVWRSRGQLLRWWRTEVRGLTQQQAADQLCVQASALSNWERGTRAIPADLAHLDRALQGGDVLAGLLRCFGTPEGIEPGHSWSKVFPGASGPVWMWIRSAAPAIRLEAEWGVARIEADLDLGSNGVFITVGTSVHDSPVVAHLSEPGWVDFGRGDLPADVPEAIVLPAIELFRPSSADGTFMELFVSSMTQKVASRSRDIANLALLAPRGVARFFAALTSTATEDRERRDHWPPHPDGVERLDRLDFARLRLARGLSLIEVAEILAVETGLDVSRDTLRRFECGIGQPHHRTLPAALDHVLGAEGRLVALEIRSARGDGIVSLPPYWHGPVWIEVAGPPQETSWALQRGKWHRELRTVGSTLLSFHWFDPAVPLRITADEALTWTVGVGRRLGAESIDQNWAPVTFDVAQQAISETELAITTALARASDDGCDRSAVQPR